MRKIIGRQISSAFISWENACNTGFGKNLAEEKKAYFQTYNLAVIYNV
ncbi:MAG TPA: hypothetical protein P5100_01225 [Candidatus Cloacimonas sp.]|nr:hypothetical protein [Candidatus Cloacimonas acidaminovorans]HQJ17684.1 hypothetical protein [Candidatus Cloacimonas acidaminovorans]HRS60273.1 hypothetical protein [Candidatus Cloacimonas sp.]